MQERKISVWKYYLNQLFIWFFHSIDLAIFENAESKVLTLISAASSPDNTCRMDPAWHPWF